MTGLGPALTPESEEDFSHNEMDAPIPEGLGVPFAYRLYIMPVSPIKMTKGGIIIPDQARDAMQWLNCIGRIAAIGKAAFKHPKYKELGMTAKDSPKVGDLVLYASRSPMRFKFKDRSFLVIQDDWIVGTLTEKEANNFKFYI